jgi:hypothetical protein
MHPLLKPALPGWIRPGATPLRACLGLLCLGLQGLGPAATVPRGIDKAHAQHGQHGPFESRPAGDRFREAEAWLPDGLIDYAPSGMPDFSQCKSAWSRSGAPPQWTHAGAVAAANALWWLDSAAEPAPAAPGIVHDGHALVTAYPHFGPARDDHAIEQVFALVQDLALRARTDRRTTSAWRGTDWAELQRALRDYVDSRRLDQAYDLLAQLAPGPGWLSARLEAQSGVVLLLGVYELQEGSWLRVGGHYASLAGSDDGAIMISDPLADEAGRGGAGRAIPPDPARHSCREAPGDHDDAALVSHDRYALVQDPAIERDRWVLSGYFEAASFGEAAAFAGLNDLGPGAKGIWQGGRVVMALDAALAIQPVRPLLPSPTSPATASPQARASPSPPPTSSPAAEPSPSPESTVTMGAPGPTETPSPDPGAVTPSAGPGAGDGKRRLWIPWIARESLDRPGIRRAAELALLLGSSPRRVDRAQQRPF